MRPIQDDPKTLGAPSRLPRYRRAEGEGPPFALTERDVALLHDLLRYRMLTTSQLEWLRSADARPECRFVSRYPLQRRLQRLYHHGYVNRLRRPIASGSLEPVYLLDREGVRELAKRHGEVPARSASQQPKEAALDHLLSVNQVRLSLEVSSAVPSGLVLASWRSGAEVAFAVVLRDWGERRERARFIPDGHAMIRNGRGRTPYFLEVDRATESEKVLARKFRAYYEYWRDGGFAADFGLTPQVGFRVLVVAPTERRAETVLSAVGALSSGHSMFWVGIEDEIRPERIAGRIFRCYGSEECRSLAE